LKSKNYLNESDFRNKKKYTIKSLIEILRISDDNIKKIDIGPFF
jgi:hypothetical protein